jgi:hypothetical protein
MRKALGANRQAEKASKDSGRWWANQPTTPPAHLVTAI